MVRRDSRTVLIIALIGLASSLLAQTYPDVEIVLIPFINTTPGALGTVWRSDLLVANPTQQDVFMAQGGPCLVGAGCYAFEHLEARSVELVADERALDNPSIIYFVEKGFAQRLSWLLRTRDASTDQNRFGSQVPVAFEKDFRSEPLELIGVPTLTRYRQNLWIWDPDGLNQSRVRVLILEETTNEVLGEREFALVHGTPRRSDILSFLQRPSIAYVLGVSTSFPRASTVDRVKIRIEPTSQSLRFWAAVFVIDNATQELSVITPN